MNGFTPVLLLVALATCVSLSAPVSHSTTPPGDEVPITLTSTSLGGDVPLAFSSTRPGGEAPFTLSYSAFRAQVRANRIATAYLSGITARGAFTRPSAPPGMHTSYRTYCTTLLPLPDPTPMPLLEQSAEQ
jgi:hypothetical protein